MTGFKKISLYNFVIMLIYNILVRGYVMLFESKADYQNISIILILMFIILAQFLVNLVLAFPVFSADLEKKQRGKQFLLNAFLVLLIGFPSCLFNTFIDAK